MSCSIRRHSSEVRIDLYKAFQFFSVHVVLKNSTSCFLEWSGSLSFSYLHQIHLCLFLSVWLYSLQFLTNVGCCPRRKTHMVNLKVDIFNLPDTELDKNLPKFNCYSHISLPDRSDTVFSPLLLPTKMVIKYRYLGSWWFIPTCLYIGFCEDILSSSFIINVVWVCICTFVCMRFPI